MCSASGLMTLFEQISADDETARDGKDESLRAPNLTGGLQGK